jgi:hypothetical protein
MPISTVNIYDAIHAKLTFQDKKLRDFCREHDLPYITFVDALKGWYRFENNYRELVEKYISELK